MAVPFCVLQLQFGYVTCQRSLKFLVSDLELEPRSGVSEVRAFSISGFGFSWENERATHLWFWSVSPRALRPCCFCWPLGPFDRRDPRISSSSLAVTFSMATWASLCWNHRTFVKLSGLLFSQNVQDFLYGNSVHIPKKSLSGSSIA